MKFFQFFKNLFQRNIAQRAFAFSFDKAFRDSFLFLALACFDIFFFPFIPIEMRFLFRSFLWFMVLFLVFYYYILGKRKQFVAPRKSLHRGQIPLYKKLKKSNKKIRKLLLSMRSIPDLIKTRCAKWYWVSHVWYISRLLSCAFARETANLLRECKHTCWKFFPYNSTCSHEADEIVCLHLFLRLRLIKFQCLSCIYI